MHQKNLAPPVPSDRLPYQVYFRTEIFPPDTTCSLHRHSWGELSYTLNGVMELTIEGKGYLSPPHYAIWTPPGVEHDGYNKYEIHYCSIYLARNVCVHLPRRPCTLALSPLIKAILADFSSRGIRYPQAPEDKRLVRVLIDQIKRARRQASYLPVSEHPLLKRLLRAMQEAPGDSRSLARWAGTLFTTERTLARLFQRELGMSFGEWRQRHRLITAILRLENPDSVQSIAFDLGYSTSSAFIAMFQRMTGTTPNLLRKQGRVADSII